MVGLLHIDMWSQRESWLTVTLLLLVTHWSSYRVSGLQVKTGPITVTFNGGNITGKDPRPVALICTASCSADAM